MSNPTSNFGWQMPTSSDLVTSLPADFEVFGQAVDTSLADLKGGTTGQILSKASGTDMDFTWVAPTTGDITGVTAGTGLTGGGTSGDVTVSLDTTSAYVLPSQTGNSGKYLTTNGTAASWGTVSAGGFTVLASGTLSGSSLDLTSISSSYVDLYLVLSGWAPNTNTGYGQMRFNNDTNTRYSFTTQTNVTSFETFGANRIDFSDGMSNTSTNQSTFVHIPAYAISGTWKTATCQTFFTDTVSSNAKYRWTQSQGFYNQTQAISAITVTPTGGFVGGTYTLYGVK